MSVKCKICNENTKMIKHPIEGSVYYCCPECEFISMDETYYLKEVDEIHRYSSHNNSMDDSGYVAYFRSFINRTILNFQEESRIGLDFGSGPEPVLANLLERDYGYEMDTYDKYFSPDRVYTGKQYDLITSTEVVEHLDDPMSYFGLFKSLMKKNGTLAIMTQFHPMDDEKFLNWHYRRDPSHISFYTPKTMQKIADLLGFEITYMDLYKNIGFKLASKAKNNKLMASLVHEEIRDQKIVDLYKRETARGVILDGNEILLIYTKVYDDFSFPGGGIDDLETIEAALARELAEETGAQNVAIIEPLGIVEELRPYHNPAYDAMQQTSYFYLCSADRELGEARPESYEITNGSVPVWVKLSDAIAHNKAVIAENGQGIGFSIHRETLVLEKIQRLFFSKIETL